MKCALILWLLDAGWTHKPKPMICHVVSSAWVKGWSLEMQTGTLNWPHFAWPRGIKVNGQEKQNHIEYIKRDFPEFQPFGIDKVLYHVDSSTPGYVTA